MTFTDDDAKAIEEAVRAGIMAAAKQSGAVINIGRLFVAAPSGGGATVNIERPEEPKAAIRFAAIGDPDRSDAADAERFRWLVRGGVRFCRLAGSNCSFHESADHLEEVSRVRAIDNQMRREGR